MEIKRRVSKKNVSRYVSDVRVLRAHEEGAPATYELVSAHKVPEVPQGLITHSASAPEIEVRHLSAKSIAIGGFVLAAFVFGSLFILGSRAHEKLAHADLPNFSEFQKALGIGGENALDGFVFASNNEPLDVGDFGYLIQNLIPLLQEGGRALGGIQTLSQAFFTIGDALSGLEEEFVMFSRGEPGKGLLPYLRSMRDALQTVSKEDESLASVAQKFPRALSLNPSGYVPFQLELAELADFMSSLVAYLESPEPRYVALVFMNPSELRPGGGFMGSYAELEIHDGALKGLIMRDIVEADRALKARYVPPEPLQGFLTRWGAADANWFFNTPDSAEHFLSFLNASDLYAERGIRFDAMVGISAEVVGDILAYTGPLTVPGYAQAISEENYLKEIQASIVASREAGEGDPKHLLKALAPRLLSAFGEIEREGRVQVFAHVPQWFKNRSLVVFAEDRDLQEFLRSHDWTGATAPLEADFFGDYLAVASANIGGEKTDLVVEQEVRFTSTLSEEGKVEDRVEVRRTHHGDTAKAAEWWYRVPNISYLKVFTPPASRLTYAEGMAAKKITPRANFSAKEYRVDPLVQAIESTKKGYVGIPNVNAFVESERNVFGAWTEVSRGKSVTASFEYARTLPSLPKDGAVYRFMFERQIGVDGAYHFTFNAPHGFRWKESGLPVLEYESEDMPGRLLLELTLQKIGE